MNTTFDEATIAGITLRLQSAIAANDPEAVEECRDIYSRELLNAGARRLLPQQHALIMQWVKRSTTEKRIAYNVARVAEAIDHDDPGIVQEAWQLALAKLERLKVNNAAYVLADGLTAGKQRRLKLWGIVRD